jgi:hypothetical protein
MNLLQELEIREYNLVKEIDTKGQRIKVSFSFPNNNYIILREFIKASVCIEIGGITITSQLSNKLFIHQLGKRMLENKYKKRYSDNVTFNDASSQYAEVLTDFHYIYNNENTQFVSYCEETFSNMELVIKYYKNPTSGKCILYGIVSTKYTNSPQTLFREKLIECLNKTGLFEEVNHDDPKMRLQNKNDLFSTVREDFQLNDRVSNKFKMVLVVIYGLNNGYRSYSMFFNRKIELNNLLLTPLNHKSLNKLVKGLIETKVANTYLEEFRHNNNYRIDFPDYVSKINTDGFLENSTNWRNNPKHHQGNSTIDMYNYIENISIKLLLYTLSFEKRIEIAMNTRYNQEDLLSYFDLLRIANASKSRIKDKIDELIENHNDSLFTVSESFRYIGSKEKAISTSTQRFLIEIGSKFLDEDNYLGESIKNGKEIVLTGNYSFVDN